MKEKKPKLERFEIVDNVSGVVTYVIEAESEEDALKQADGIDYPLGCLQQVESLETSANEVAGDTPLDEIVEGEDGGRLLLKRKVRR